MRFVYLRERPDLVPVIAQWIWDEWRDLLTQNSLEEFTAWFRGTDRGRGLPTTLVAMIDDAAVGTVSLECDDMELRPDLTPWLASLYVSPAQRRRGYGRALVRAAEAEARELGIAEIFLYTPGRESFYAALGWEHLDDCQYRGTPVAIMRHRLAAS